MQTLVAAEAVQVAIIMQWFNCSPLGYGLLFRIVLAVCESYIVEKLQLMCISNKLIIKIRARDSVYDNRSCDDPR